MGSGALVSRLPLELALALLVSESAVSIPHAIKLGKMVAEMRANYTWVQAVGEKTFAAQLLGKGYGEEHVGCLGLAICGPLVVRLAIIKVVVVLAHVAEAVAVAAHVDNTRSFRRQQLVHDEVGEEKVAEVVGGKLALEAIGRQLVVGSHDAGIVDEDVDDGDVGPREDSGCRSAGRGERVAVQLDYLGLDAGAGGLDVARRLLGLGRISRGEDEERGLGFGNGQDKRGAEAAGGDAGGEDDLALDLRGVMGGELAGSGGGVECGRHVDGCYVMVM